MTLPHLNIHIKFEVSYILGGSGLLCAAVLGHVAACAAVHVAGVIAVPAVVLPNAEALPPPPAGACRQHRRKWWKLENYWGDTKPNSKAGAIDTHKHPLKPKSLPFKVGRAWNREIDAFIVSRLGTRE